MPQSPLRATPRLALALLPALLGAPLAQAQAPTASPATASRISQVTVYPGLAVVERIARVAAQARSATFACLPAGLDVASLQVQADAGVRVGEFSVHTEERELATGCTSPLDGRIRELEDQVAAVQAEAAALQLVDSYLKGVAQGGPPEGPSARPQPALPAQIGATAEALRKASAESLARGHQLLRRQEALEQQLKPLRAERDRVARQQGRVVAVTVQLATEREAELRLNYQVRGPSWQPSYRATLDLSQATVRLDRLALVAQATGEDWSNVALTLSTGQPGRGTQPPLPRPWTLDVAPPARALPAAAPAPAMAMSGVSGALAKSAAESDALPTFDVTEVQKAYASTFTVPQRVSVQSNGQRITLGLGGLASPVTLLARTTPQQEEAAYLVAQLPRPAGVWPAGSVSLYRDGQFAGTGRLDFDAAPAGAGDTELAFGRDELLRVRAEPPQERTGSAGLTGARTERQLRRTYRIENRHPGTVTVQVLHASPTSRHEKIEVESSYQPQPTELRWRQREGTVAWQQTLAAGASAQFSAEHTLRYPKELELQERR